MTIKILIVDDHAIVRAGLRALITAESDFELVGEATGGLEALMKVEENPPDVLVLDISMPDMDGIEIIKQLKLKGAKCSILVLTVHEDEALLREAIRLGASRYIIKHAAEAELINAVRTVYHGDIYIHQSMIRSLLREKSTLPVLTTTDQEPLTAREEDVLRLIVQGYTNKDVAEQLGISVRTVEGHRANLTEKLGIRSRVDLLRYAREHKII